MLSASSSLWVQSAKLWKKSVDYLNAQGQKVGVLKVRLYRPFSAEHFLKVLPKTVKRIAVLDRSKEPGALGEALYEDVRNLFYDMDDRPMIIGGRYGLGSKDVTPAQLLAVYENLAADAPKKGFTIGIVDDVTHTSLPVGAQSLPAKRTLLPANSGATVLTVQSVPIKTPSRSSATIPICSHKDILRMTPKNPAVSPCLT